jgi:hypothetical protein
LVHDCSALIEHFSKIIKAARSKDQEAINQMIAHGALLVVLWLFQTASPDTAPTQKKPVDATQQAPGKKKTPSVNWEVHIPFVACENGTPVLNVEVPDVNAPAALCPGVQPPDVLPQVTPITGGTQNAEYETGTVIAVGVSHEKIVIAADSRNVLVTQTTLADGTVERRIKYDDCACKLTQLTPTLLFAADGQVSLSSNTLPANALYDAHKLARLAAQNYHSNPNSKEEQFAGGMIEAIAIRWAWDVDFRIHHAFASGLRPIDTLEGIFVGLEPNGEIGIVVAKLKYPRPRTGVRVPPVTFTVGRLNPPPTDFTWVEAFGMKDVAETYYSAPATEQTKAENQRISGEMLKDPKFFSPKVAERLVDLTIQHYQAVAGQEGLLYVHGPIDVAVLERKKRINWIHWKKCSGAPNKHAEGSLNWPGPTK